MSDPLNWDVDQAKTLIVIAGPTAVGKTSLSICLALKLQTEIISADSRQLFRELKIGTAMPSQEELRAVKHHFMASKSIFDAYDAAQYGVEARTTIHQLFQKYNTLILCGGSGLYIKAVLDGFDDMPEIPVGVRAELTKQYRKEGLTWLQKELKAKDPEYFQIMDIKNPQRLMRALEIVQVSGKSVLSFQKRKKHQNNFEVIKIGLTMPREELYTRINLRMDEMIERGLFEEAASLKIHQSIPALQTVGYQEIFGWMDHRYSKEEAIRLLKQNSRHYAKRQMTWFRKDPEMTWFAPDEQQVFLYLEQKLKQ